MLANGNSAGGAGTHSAFSGTINSSHRGVKGIGFVKTRQVGAEYLVDLGIQVGPRMGVEKAERLAADLRRDLMQRSERFSAVQVFVAPLEPAQGR